MLFEMIKILQTTSCVIISLTSCNFSDIFICCYMIFNWLIKKNLSSIRTLYSSIFSVGRKYHECPIVLSLALNVKIKSLITPWNFGSIKKSKYWFWALCVFVFVSYLFQLIMRFNPHFNYCNSSALSSVDKVTTWT